MKSILFVSKDMTAASTRYRALAYFPYLRQAGWNPSHLSANSTIFPWTLIQQARQADVVVVLRKVFSFHSLYLLRRAARRLVFDFDDAVFVHNDASPSRRRTTRFARMVRQADHVFAGNRYLVDIATHFTSRVTLLPTTLEPKAYPLAEQKDEGRLDLVWIGSRSTARYLSSLLPLLQEAAEEIPTLRLKVIADFTPQADRLTIMPVPWSPENEAVEVGTAHIGIAPMPTDAWTVGKCGLKVLQYMAAGLPVVASGGGIHDHLVQDGVTGFLPTNQAAWMDALRRLAIAPSLRAAMGLRGRLRLEESYATAAVFPTMKAVLESCVK
jgi:glycosyltransferase involved in cell wall biosynthesis